MKGIARPKCEVCGENIVHLLEHIESLSPWMQRFAAMRMEARWGSDWEKRARNYGYCPNRCGPEYVKKFPYSLYKELSVA